LQPNFAWKRLFKSSKSVLHEQKPQIENVFTEAALEYILQILRQIMRPFSEDKCGDPAGSLSVFIEFIRV
jgi:hypothetical protein